jgi:hypothetical protein
MVHGRISEPWRYFSEYFRWYRSKELLKQHDDDTEEPLSLELGSLPIKKYLVKNENRLCFKGKEKEGIQKLSKKIQYEMDSYTKETI